MNSYWEKLVDSYVDGECSNEERLAVEARAKIDSDVDRAIKRSEELRAILRATPRGVPKEFEARLRDAILNAPGRGADRVPNAARVGRVFSDASRRTFNPVAVGTVASLLICLGVGYAWLTLSHGKSDGSSEPLAQTERSAETPTFESSDSEPWKLIPSPEGNAPESASKADSQENCWVVVLVDDAAQTKNYKRKLQALCAELDVSFSKFGSDEQMRLQDVSREQWIKIADVWSESEVERSEALTRWTEESQEKRTIRVAFKTKSTEM